MANDLDLDIPIPCHPSCKVEFVDKEKIYAEADIISLHVPLTSNTKNMITKDEISLMRPGTFLINTSRGGIINESDLYWALDSGHLGGAAVDVFEREPYHGCEICTRRRDSTGGSRCSSRERCRVGLGAHPVSSGVQLVFFLPGLRALCRFLNGCSGSFQGAGNGTSARPQVVEETARWCCQARACTRTGICPHWKC